MEEDESLIESMKLALQAQEEIKQQLLKEIASLEASTQGPRLTEKSLKFYKSSLDHDLKEKKLLTDQITKFKSSILPEVQQQYDRIHQKRVSLEEHISVLQKLRDESLITDISDPNKRSSAISTFQSNLQSEIQSLSNEEKELQEKTAKAKTELHVLQEQYLNSQRESAKKIWEDELANEMGNNKAHFVRRRSLTVSMMRKNQHPLALISKKGTNEMPVKRKFNEL
ncbi:hypothetical protein M9Y10_034041 [Tritrichomonas musculus]|uniref:Uncharacterized protein n=1 Tax=Tritrichomonas musculus TaxID=1915356 RepID=A0ABR2KGY4_9EUKA